MKFRFKALALHLLASVVALTLLLGTLYFGWYRWPGWYLADAGQVVKALVGVDLVVGPLLTFVVARSTKPRRELARDIAVIVAVQLFAMIYGAVSLWNGRPLYYAYSETVLQVVQAYDINSEESEIARQKNAALAAHWYSLPRWIWAPLPQNSDERNKIVAAATMGGDDVVSHASVFQTLGTGFTRVENAAQESR